ncbi:MAG: hypothetical protein EOP56_18530 [Sphingobacteriales bacterium]|nr:MAG: hypothetical protein EOP56_18530 [Sphingobacteriales bacterium]
MRSGRNVSVANYGEGQYITAKSTYIIFASMYLLLQFIGYSSDAQIKPAENSKLNHLITGFSIPVQDKITTYQLEIAEGTFADEKEFSDKISITVNNSGNNIITELPEFGRHYTWRVKYLNKKGKKKGKSPLFHFATNMGPEVDTSKHRLRIISNSKADPNLLIITDTKGVIYNTSGKPVWYFPEINGEPVRDFKPTADGTFTFMTFRQLYEVDYNGNVVWKRSTSVNGDSLQRFHHELTKLPNGHYMVCGHDFGYQEVPPLPDSLRLMSRTLVQRDGKLYKRTLAGTLIELDENGKEVWKWNSANIVPDSIIFAHIKIGRPDALLPTGGTHMNGFYFSHADSIIYVSFRNINTILKIGYPSGKLLSSIGQYKNAHFIEIANMADTPFFHQHHPTINSRGELQLFDNNASVERNGASMIAVFKESSIKPGEIDKIWEFSCDIDTNTKRGSLSGGSVYELPDGNFLACTGESGRILVVTREKKVLFNAISEKTNEMGSLEIEHQYRSNYLLFNQLKKFIYKIDK